MNELSLISTSKQSNDIDRMHFRYIMMMMTLVMACLDQNTNGRLFSFKMLYKKVRPLLFFSRQT